MPGPPRTPVRPPVPPVRPIEHAGTVIVPPRFDLPIGPLPASGRSAVARPFETPWGFMEKLARQQANKLSSVGGPQLRDLLPGARLAEGEMGGEPIISASGFDKAENTRVTSNKFLDSTVIVTRRAFKRLSPDEQREVLDRWNGRLVGSSNNPAVNDIIDELTRLEFDVWRVLGRGPKPVAVDQRPRAQGGYVVEFVGKGERPSGTPAFVTAKTYSGAKMKRDSLNRTYTLDPDVKYQVSPYKSNLREIPALGTAEPKNFYSGEHPAWVDDPTLGIEQLANYLIERNYRTDIEEPLRRIKRGLEHAVETDAITQEDALKLWRILRGSVQGYEGHGQIAQTINGVINSGLSAFGIGPIQDPVGRAARLVTGYQHVTGLTSPMSNLAREMEVLIQVIPETGYGYLPNVANLERSGVGRAYMVAFADAYGVGSPADPRFPGSASRITNVALTGHRYMTNKASRHALQLVTEHQIRLGRRPDMLVHFDRDGLIERYPKLTPNQAFAQQMAEWNNLELSRTKRLREINDNRIPRGLPVVSYRTLRQKEAEGVFGSGAVYFDKAMADWTYDETMRRLDDQWIPLGGSLEHQAKAALLGSMYLRWPGYELSLFNQLPTTGQLIFTYRQPAWKQAARIGSVHAKALMELIRAPADLLSGNRTSPELSASWAFLGRYWANRIALGGLSQLARPANVVSRGVSTVTLGTVGGKDYTYANMLEDFAGNKESAQALYFGLWAIIGRDFSHSLDASLLPGSAFDLLGEGRPDNPNVWWELAAFLQDFTVGSSALIGMGSGPVRRMFGLGGDRRPFQTALEGTGMGKGVSRSARALFGLPYISASGRTPEESYGRPPRFPEPGVQPNQLLERDFSQQERAYFAALARTAIKDAQELRRVLEVLQTPGPVRIADLSPITPKPYVPDVLGGQSVERSAFYEMQRAASQAAPTPQDGPWAWAAYAPTKLKNYIADSAGRFAERWAEQFQAVGQVPPALSFSNLELQLEVSKILDDWTSHHLPELAYRDDLPGAPFEKPEFPVGGRPLSVRTRTFQVRPTQWEKEWLKEFWLEANNRIGELYPTFRVPSADEFE